VIMGKVSLRDIMDNKKILLVKLDSGRLHENGYLVGAILVTLLQTASLSRGDTQEDKRVRFYIYIDEFQDLANDALSKLFSQVRKYEIGLTLAHQTMAQLPKDLQKIILGNCGLHAYFKVLREDAAILSKEGMAPVYASPPGWETYTQELQTLDDRYFVMANKVHHDVVKLFTAQNPTPYQQKDRFDTKKLRREVKNSDMGHASFRKREDIEREHRELVEAFYEKTGGPVADTEKAEDDSGDFSH